MIRAIRRVCLALATALVVALAVGGLPASACSCIPASVAERLAWADVAFQGRAIEQRGIDVGRIRAQATTFIASRVWKGPVRLRYEVLAYPGGTTCGLPLSVNTTYLVFASYNPAVRFPGDIALEAGLCSGTKPTDAAAADLVELGIGTPLGRVCPQVAHRLPPDAVAGVLDDPWRFGGYGQLADPGRPPSPYNPERTWLSLRNPHAPPGPMNAPTWKAYCP